MKTYKAPGPDGFQPFFYQSWWRVIGSSVCKFIRRILDDSVDVADFNQTCLVLIPKILRPEFLHQFRPTGLCNVNYKILTKLMVNRLTNLLLSLVTKYQSSFVPRRQITYNIIVAQEIIHSMGKLKGRKGYMVTKVDLKKAYDRLKLMGVGLSSQIVNLIIKCNEIASLQILWNGTPSANFAPMRGIRHGDPCIFML
jgi:hypothetical protein